MHLEQAGEWRVASRVGDPLQLERHPEEPAHRAVADERPQPVRDTEPRSSKDDPAGRRQDAVSFASSVHTGEI